MSLKLQKGDPKGFIASQQALKCDYDNAEAAASWIHRLLIDKLDNGDRLQQSVIRKRANEAVMDFGGLLRRRIPSPVQVRA